MKKYWLLILSFVTATFTCWADANWKMHPTFDSEVDHVIETPGFVYFTSRNIPQAADGSSLSLFRFDKEGEELISLSTDNLLSGTLIKDVVYNPEKNYLFVLYEDNDIDILYNDGKVIRIPYYAMASTSSSKNVNAISIDPVNDRVYLATDFGYVAINDKKNEIAESRNYDTELNDFCRLGDYYLALKQGYIYMSPVTDSRFSLDDYTRVSASGYQRALYPLNENSCIIKYYGDNKEYLRLMTLNSNGKYSFKELFGGPFFNFDYNAAGLSVTTDKRTYLIDKEGNFSYKDLPEEFQASSTASTNLTEVWCGKLRKGLASLRYSGDECSLTRNYMLPNSPAVSFATSFAHHPTKGLLVLNYGYTAATYNMSQQVPLQLSSHLSGRWKNHAPAYTNPDRTNICYMSNGIAIDPDNPNLVYITSLQAGIIRLNLDDPKDIIHMSRPNDPDASNDGFIALVETPVAVKSYTNFSRPYFDSKGNLWMNFTNWDDSANPNPHLYCWLAEDRKNTTSAENVRLPRLVEVDAKVDLNNRAFVMPLIKTGAGLLLHVGFLYDESLMIIDTNNTPIDPKDDKIYRFNDFVDGDGNTVEVRQIRCAWEDPSTGYVWIGHRNGLCYFIPSETIKGNYEVNRIKVSRNDGTNLADYLLEGVAVNNITADSKGRKWFATNGGGVICTSSNGKEILMEFNTDNSPLPSDEVYGITYDQDANSILFSTSEGLAEYFLPMDQQTAATNDIKAYPNPVRPDFASYVTITDIPQGSLVKIVDATGNLVKDLGTMSGFEMLWDISDTSHSRVKSGVYYILVSPGNESGSFAKVGKILVMN